MKTLLVTTPQAKIEAKAFRELVPNKLAGWHIKTVPCRSLRQMAILPDVTLVQLNDETRPSELEAIMPDLVHIQAEAPKRSYVLFSVKEGDKGKWRTVRARVRHYHDVMTQINRELPTFPNPDRVSVSFAQSPAALLTELDHIRAKLDLVTRITDIHTPKAVSRPSPLDHVKEIVEATGDLRVANGKLSAAAVAPVFGVSLSQLADWLGRTRQRLNKTPDADSLQDDLSFFERVARLRAILPKDGFLKWLRIPNAELDDQKPLDLLASGERQVVADLVDDILTGAPA
jgi:Protein of unknown function (DUF2384)